MIHLPVFSIEKLVLPHRVLIVRLLSLLRCRDHEIPGEIEDSKDDIVLQASHELDEISRSKVIPR